MSERQEESPHLTHAKLMIEEVQGQPLNPHQRMDKAVDLAALILLESEKELSREEKKQQAEIARMMRDPMGKAFTLAMTDECFRSDDPVRVADQMIHLMNTYGIPQFLSPFKRLQLTAFKMFGMKFPKIFVPLATYFLRKQTAKVIIPGEKGLLRKHIQKRRAEGVRLNLNHLGEAILGEQEAERRLNVYLHDLEEPLIDYVSIKISTIYSQINLTSYDDTLEAIAARLRQLYSAAMKNPVIEADGSKRYKFVNLDMEEYKDLHLTKDVFIKVLSEPEFLKLPAGIVLQAYLPDSHELQKEITQWAQKRVAEGGAHIKIRIVKGANLAMEQVEASLRGWEQTPYTAKVESDANYKRLVTYGCNPERAKAAHLGIASHNLFDIAYALLLRSEEGVEEEVTFEMLEGMADHTRRVIQKLAGGILLYCAVAKKADFQSAIAYLIRRLDENTGVENFLSHSFSLVPGSSDWQKQENIFREACSLMHEVIDHPRRTQNRQEPPKHLPITAPFENEADTDFAMESNRIWAKEILESWKDRQIPTIPLVIGGEEIIHDQPSGQGFDPSKPGEPIYRYCEGSWDEISRALDVATEEEKSWSALSVVERCELIQKASEKLREKRSELIGSMIADGGKLIAEGDVEISEAIDFAEYYLRSMEKLAAEEDLKWTPKGTVLVAPPWNFPTSIPAGGIISGLITGNTVLFKPAPESVLAGWELVKAFWEAGISKKALQFINCDDESVGSKLIQDKRLNTVILTGGTETAKLFMKIRPGLDLSAETGGKNALIITKMADLDLACRDLIHSAFGHNGQKCSAASLGILEADVYDSPRFRQQLKDAAMSLKVGPAWDPSNKVTPLIREPGKTLYRGLTQLDEGEEWLLEPKQDPSNPQLWSPGIKLGVKKGSYSHTNEFFGPVLSLMRAENLFEAIKFANSTPYGLTSGIHSLDDRERAIWERSIIAGNCYINRGITGAIVQRQAFGGTKNSSFGHGSKAGGPNYLKQLMHVEQVGIPKEKFPVGDWINNLSRLLEKIELSAEELGIWYASVASYAFWWNRFKRKTDLSKVVGEDNHFKYVQHKKIAFRISNEDKPIDFLRVFAAALTCETPLNVSWDPKSSPHFVQANWQVLLPIFNLIEESEEEFIERIKAEKFKRIRFITPPNETIKKVAADCFSYLDTTPVLANGRIELLHYLREVSVSFAYHRYGNLGTRENELRRPIL